jgi:ATP-binding cassette, subfamily B, bacterial
MTLVAQIVGAAALAVVLFSGRAIVERLTAANPSTSLRDFIPAIAYLTVSLFLAGLSTVVAKETRLLVGECVSRRLEAEIIDIGSSVDYEQFERQQFHDLLDRANNQGAQSALQVVYDILNLINAFATSIALIVVVATSVPQVLPGLAVISIPFLFAARRTARVAFRTYYELTPRDRLRFYLYRALTGKREAKELRVLNLHGPLRQRWSTLCNERLQRMRDLVKRRTILNGLATLAGAALIAGVLVIVVDASVEGRVSLGDAAVAIVGLQQLSGRVRAASNSWGSLHQSALFLDDFSQFSALRQDRHEESAAPPLAPLSILRVENVSFRYPGTERTVLEDVSLEIHRGEIVAIVGVSGSGKTTLAHLVAGLYRPTDGRVTWNGTDVRDVPLNTYWRSLAVVFQDFVRYELSARENITMSDHGRLDDIVAAREAAERAGIASAIERLPAGYESMLSRAYDDGVELSVGQWQRMAVARAFFREAPLLVLDEPAAALDSFAEQQLYAHIEELCTSRSVLLISHRFSTVRLANRIVVMHDGKIVESGTHTELIRRDGHYAQMFRVQAAGYVDSM